MKKYLSVFCILAVMLFAAPAFVSADDFTPLTIPAGGTGAGTIEDAKVNLEIPNVVQTAGSSTTSVMSQKATTDAIAAGSGGGIVVTQSTGSSTTSVMSQNAVTLAINASQTSIIQTTGQDIASVMSQKATTDAINTAAQNTIVQTTGQDTTSVMSQKAVTDVIGAIPQITIEPTTGSSTISVMSQKATTDAILNSQTIFNMIWPVNSIYFSVSNMNPGLIFGGTWVAWGSGQVPVGVNTSDTDFNTVEKAGGEKMHTLNVSEMPSHTHSLWYSNENNQSQGYPANGFRAVWATDRNVANGGSAVVSSGDSGAHNNLQPYLTCYMWKRIA